LFRTSGVEVRIEVTLGSHSPVGVVTDEDVDQARLGMVNPL
jgi:hypothetical protein